MATRHAFPRPSRTTEQRCTHDWSALPVATRVAHPLGRISSARIATSFGTASSGAKLYRAPAFSSSALIELTTRLLGAALLLANLACGPQLIANDPTDAATEDATSNAEPEPSETAWTDDAEDSTTGAEENSCVPGVGDCPDGFKCQPYVKEDGACCVDADMCVPITGDQQWNEDCTRERYGDDCAKDLVCFAGTSGKEGPGRCKQLCDGSDGTGCEHLPLDSFCLVFGDGKMPMCESACHPLRPECPEGNGCYFGASWFLCSESDPDPGKGNDGDDCYTIQSCHPGLLCTSGETKPDCESDYCCTTYCDLTADEWPCRDDESCVPMFDPADAETDPTWIDIGFCGVDPK